MLVFIIFQADNYGTPTGGDEENCPAQTSLSFLVLFTRDPNLQPIGESYWSPFDGVGDDIFSFEPGA